MQKKLGASARHDEHGACDARGAHGICGTHVVAGVRDIHDAHGVSARHDAHGASVRMTMLCIFRLFHDLTLTSRGHLTLCILFPRVWNQSPLVYALDSPIDCEKLEFNE